MNLLEIKILTGEKGITLKKLSQLAGMSEQNLHRCISLNKISATDLESIAKILEVPVGYFFDEIKGEVVNTRDKDEVIALQKKMIVLLEDKNAFLEERLEKYEGKAKNVG